MDANEKWTAAPSKRTVLAGTVIPGFLPCPRHFEPLLLFASIRPAAAGSRQSEAAADPFVVEICLDPAHLRLILSVFCRFWAVTSK